MFRIVLDIVVRGRKPEGEGRAMVQPAGDVDSALMFFDNLLRNGEAEPEPRLLGGKIGLKNLCQRLLAYSDAGVANADLDGPIRSSHQRRQIATGRHRLESVDRYVRHTGFQSFSVTVHLRHPDITIDRNTNALKVGLGPDERYGLFNQVSDIDSSQGELWGSTEVQQVSHHLVQPQDLILYGREYAGELLAFGFVLRRKLFIDVVDR